MHTLMEVFLSLQPAISRDNAETAITAKDLILIMMNNNRLVSYKVDKNQTGWLRYRQKKTGWPDKTSPSCIMMLYLNQNT